MPAKSHLLSRLFSSQTTPPFTVKFTMSDDPDPKNLSGISIFPEDSEAIISELTSRLAAGAIDHAKLVRALQEAATNISRSMPTGKPFGKKELRTDETGLRWGFLQLALDDSKTGIFAGHLNGTDYNESTNQTSCILGLEGCVCHTSGTEGAAVEEEGQAGTFLKRQWSRLQRQQRGEAS